MPLPYVKKVAKKHGMSTKKAEDKWDDAKKAADKQGQADNYAYRTAIFKKMTHESQTMSLDQQLAKQVKARLEVKASNSIIDSILVRFAQATKSKIKPLWKRDETAVFVTRSNYSSDWTANSFFGFMKYDYKSESDIVKLKGYRSPLGRVFHVVDCTTSGLEVTATFRDYCCILEIMDSGL